MCVYITSKAWAWCTGGYEMLHLLNNFLLGMFSSKSSHFMRLFDFMTLEKLSLSLKHYWATLQVVSECRKSQEIGQDTQAIVLIRLDLLFRFIKQSRLSWKTLWFHCYKHHWGNWFEHLFYFDAECPEKSVYLYLWSKQEKFNSEHSLNRWRKVSLFRWYCFCFTCLFFFLFKLASLPCFSQACTLKPYRIFQPKNSRFVFVNYGSYALPLASSE